VNLICRGILTDLRGSQSYLSLAAGDREVIANISAAFTFLSNLNFKYRNVRVCNTTGTISGVCDRLTCLHSRALPSGVQLARPPGPQPSRVWCGMS
jgi:hypothetical protein